MKADAGRSAGALREVSSHDVLSLHACKHGDLEIQIAARGLAFIGRLVIDRICNHGSGPSLQLHCQELKLQDRLLAALSAKPFCCCRIAPCAKHKQRCGHVVPPRTLPASPHLLKVPSRCSPKGSPSAGCPAAGGRARSTHEWLGWGPAAPHARAFVGECV
eukprot:1153724-Pelagomonas_calceolata.AAC.1